MAHLSDDCLPSDFDVVIEGTGLIESILASALARCGKSVLHLDKNGFYGGLWASLMHKELQEWIQTTHQIDEQTRPSICDENVISIQQASCGVSNLSQTVHGSEETDQKVASEQELPSWSSLDPLKRRMVYDLCPKVLACRGMMVDLLTKSGCSRYVEFKAVSKICIFQSGKVEQVPCSRADVFESKLVSMMEKRKMMKFLAHCSNFEEEIDVRELNEITFMDYLRRSNLTDNLIQYVLLCIAMTEGSAPALEGLQAAKLFLKSLGRFDNAPFLYPVFGGGELPQAFCRYCAVYGGVYCLKRSITSLVLSKTTEQAVSGITCSNGQHISCRAVICNASVIKTTFSIEPNMRISRCMVLADGPVQDTQGKLTLLTIPPFSAGATQSVVVQLLQLDPSTNTAIDGTYMAHLICKSVAASAKEDLEASVHLLYNTQDDSDCNVLGPRVLWSLYFNLDLHEIKAGAKMSTNLPNNVYMTSDPDPTRTYERAVQEAEILFKKLCPEEDFLKPPETDTDT